MSNAAAKKVAADLKAEQTVRRQCKERISTMALELKDATSRCQVLEKDNKAKAADLDKDLQEAKEARSKSRAAQEEIQQAGEIAAGKPFLLQTKFGDPKYAPLNQLWCSPDAFMDLPKSAADVNQFFHAQEGHAMEKLFWSQFDTPKRPLLNEQMAQWAELHRMSGTTMKDVIARLWPTEPISDSYLGLVWRLVNVVPRIDAVKRMDLARVKTYCVDMEATSIATQSPAGSQDPAEHYFE